MWVVSNKGFLSIVAKDRDGEKSAPGPDAEISVRFRRRCDAAALFPQHEVVMTPRGDYGCRVFPTRGEVADVMVREVLGIRYGNFKDSIPADDHALHDVCMSAWSTFARLQPGGAHGRDLRKRSPKVAGRGKTAA